VGSLGTSVRSQVRSLIGDANLRSEITLTPLTRTKGSRGGYEQVSVSEGTARTVYAIPSGYVKGRVGLEKFGDLKEGEVRVLIRDDETLDENDGVTFNGDDFNIREVRNVYFNEIVIAQSLTLNRRLDT
jgi:hypothetical protein